ncbi:MAG TPA: flagellar hook-associated protein FlgK [Chloroflexota bacterium]
MSTFSGIEILLRAMRAQQYQVEVANHNIANANTPGYSRQSAELAASTPYTLPGMNHPVSPGQLGTGVEVVAIRRAHDRFVAYQIRSELSLKGNWAAQWDAARQVEAVFNEPSGSGLSTLLDRFWQSWQELGSAPDDSGVRANLVEQAAALADGIRRNYDHLLQLRADLNDEVRVKVDEINTLATRIAGLNVQITQIEAVGHNANDLRDQRDLLLEQLSEIAGINVIELDNGSVQVSLGGRALVDGQNTYTVAATLGAGGLYQVQWSVDGAPVQVDQGALAGILTARDSTIANRIAALDAWSVRLMTAVNNVHKGWDPATGTPVASVYDLETPGTPVTRDFFVGTGAADIAVNSQISGNVNLIAASRTANGTADGANALALAALKYDVTAGGGTSGKTINGEYEEFITRLGSDARAAEGLVENQDVLLHHLRRRRESVSGVSIEEETARLIQAQRTFQAASRALTALDEMLNKLINQTGLVGR